MTTPDLYALAEELGRLLKARRATLVTAESCTGGGLAEAITRVSGSSQWFERGFVTYSNDAKRELLEVSSRTLRKYGAVSEPAVAEMTAGALKHSRATVAVAVSGIAGPEGGSPGKPVGTICLAWQIGSGAAQTETCLLKGDRQSIREQAIARALAGLVARCRPRGEPP